MCFISLEEQPVTKDIQFVQEGLYAYNRLWAPGDQYQPLTVLLRASDKTVLGGLLGETYWGWLHINILWLHENVRNQGYGTQLLGLAEQEAIRRGCHAVHLDTLSFQAPDFYERHGYKVFGVLHNHPGEHFRFFLKKELRSPGLSASTELH